MSETVIIEKCNNGYIYKTEHERYITKTTEELFDALLLIFEHRSKDLNGLHYGKVAIENVKKEQ